MSRAWTLTIRGPAASRGACHRDPSLREHPTPIDDGVVVDVSAPVIEAATHEHLEVAPRTCALRVEHVNLQRRGVMLYGGGLEARSAGHVTNGLLEHPADLGVAPVGCAHHIQDSV